MNVPKPLHLVQRNEKLPFWCAQVTQWCEDWTGSFENFDYDLRNVPKRLRKTVKLSKYILFKLINNTKVQRINLNIKLVVINTIIIYICVIILQYYS